MNYYIDLENVGIQGLVGAEKLKDKDNIIVFVSDHTPENGVLKKLAITKAHVSIEFVSTTAKNAMDFCLISCVGAAVAKGKKDICIVSKDRGYDAARLFWHEHGVKILASDDLLGNRDLSSIITDHSDLMPAQLPSSPSSKVFACSASIESKPMTELKPPQANAFQSLVRRLLFMSLL